MPSFTVRVELHGVDETDSDAYAKLHEEMEKKGFRRILKWHGVRYYLPTAEYSCSGEDLTSNAVLKKAKSAAEAAWVDEMFAILVTETDSPRAQFGLTPVEG